MKIVVVVGLTLVFLGLIRRNLLQVDLSFPSAVGKTRVHVCPSCQEGLTWLGRTGRLGLTGNGLGSTDHKVRICMMTRCFF